MKHLHYKKKEEVCQFLLLLLSALERLSEKEKNKQTVGCPGFLLHEMKCILH